MYVKGTRSDCMCACEDGVLREICYTNRHRHMTEWCMDASRHKHVAAGDKHFAFLSVSQPATLVVHAFMPTQLQLDH